MRFSVFVSLLMLLSLTLAIPLQMDGRPAIDTFSSFENFNLFDNTIFLQPDPQDNSIPSPVEDITSFFAPTPFIADDNDNDMNDDIQFLLSSSDTTCPAEKRKRDIGICSSPAASPSLAIPSVFNSSD